MESNSLRVDRVVHFLGQNLVCVLEHHRHNGSICFRKKMNDNDVETSKDIGKRRTSRERESKSSTIKANVET